TTLLSKAKLPPSMWTDAASTFVHVNNRTPSETRDFKSPYELFYDKVPSVKHLRTWGCLAYVHLQKDQRHGTFGARAKRCIFLRY
ncbi:copia protein, partial [Serendipita vermifera]